MKIKLIVHKYLPVFLRLIKNKYIVIILIFCFWISFFDENNLMDRFSSIRSIKQMKKEKEYYSNKIRTDSKRLRELKNNNNVIEEFAREQYLMKKENEDLFIIVHEK